MLNHFACGSFHHEEEDEACSKSPRKSRRSKNKNPYSLRGLDQFSALLADLDKKRQEIYSQMRPQDISFVRFVSSNTNDFVPIVVKVKNKDQKYRSEELKVRHVKSYSEATDEPVVESPAAMEARKPSNLGSDKRAEKKSFSGNIRGHPSFYLSVMLILILTLLTMFGRSVATICTCILWYMLTSLKDTSSSIESMKKKHYTRGLSEKKMASHSGALEDKSTRKFGRQKSW